MDSRFKVGETVRWSTLNADCRGVVVAHDTLGMGYMAVKMASGRRMLVHESSARPAGRTVEEQKPC